jgi:Flp pilus assembly pilin Flp
MKEKTMKMFKLQWKKAANQFSEDESGAVTVDWVVLTAALVGIGLTVISTIRGGINNAATDIRNQLSSAYTG